MRYTRKYFIIFGYLVLNAARCLVAMRRGVMLSGKLRAVVGFVVKSVKICSSTYFIDLRNVKKISGLSIR